MKIVAFTSLKKRKRKSKVKIICISKMFNKLMVFFGIALTFLILNLISNTFISTVETSVFEFIKEFV